VALSKLERDFASTSLEIEHSRTQIKSIRVNSNQDEQQLSSKEEGEAVNASPSAVGLKQLTSVPEVDAIGKALEEERLQELRRINQDLVLVNEMFK
jgi:hypothetical protein